MVKIVIVVEGGMVHSVYGIGPPPRPSIEIIDRDAQDPEDKTKSDDRIKVVERSYQKIY